MKSKVYLVGAGPGDEKLMTLRGMELLQKADAVIYDHLVNPRLLSYCKKECYMIYAGKEASKHTLSQEEINEQLVTLSKEYETVVRLKGGDPYVFGRGGEEGITLYEEKIPFEVIPGISSALAGPTYGGIPLTFRGVATSFHVITGHEAKDEQKINYGIYAHLPGTLVVLMGIGNIDKITKDLILEGKSPDTAVAIIYQATTTKQKVYEGSLGNIAQMVKEEQIQAPSVIVIGEVVRYRKQLEFLSKKSLFAKKILLTRGSREQSGFAQQVEEQGAQVLILPTIKIEESKNRLLEERLKRLDEYSAIAFSSKKTVEIFFRALWESGRDARDLAGKKIFAVGEETAMHLLKNGIRADYIPIEFGIDGLMDLVNETLTQKDRLLFPRSKKALRSESDLMKEKIAVDEFSIYEINHPLLSESHEIKNELPSLEEVLSCDYFTFSSASTVEGFSAYLKKQGIEDVSKLECFSMGPMTTNALLEAGFKIIHTATVHSYQGLVDCMMESAAKNKEEGKEIG